MMKNQKKATIIGTILIIIIIIGSWWFTRFLLYNQEKKLLSEVREFSNNINSDNTISNNNLTMEQIRDILITWNDNRDIKVHEPTINQLTMDEAVNKAIDDIKYFCEKAILPKDFETIDDYWNTQAFLGSKVSADKDFKEVYSYWTIRFRTDELNIEVRQNAYTGDIWRIVAYDFTEDKKENINIEEALKVYSDYLGINMSNYSKSELGYGSLTSEDSTLLLTIQSNKENDNLNSLIEISLLPN